MSQSAAKDASTFPGAYGSLVLYIVIALAMTWPLALHLGDRVPLGGNNVWQNYWNQWWWKTSITEHGQSPWHTDMIYQPGDVSLALHTNSPANVLSMLPVAACWNEAAALGLATLLGFVLSAWGGYFLAREVVGCRRGAFAAGLVLAYLPQHFEQSLEHINLASYQAMPFFLCFFLRLLRHGGRSSIILTGFFFSLNALYSWHNGLLILPAGAILLLCALLCPDRPRLRVVRDVSMAAGLSFVIVLPFAWPLLHEMMSGDTAYLKAAVPKGIDPVFLLIPASNHPLWGKLFAAVYGSWRTYQSVGFTCYLGVPALILAALGCRGSRSCAQSTRLSSSYLWLAIFCLYLVLALGHSLTFAGTDTGIPLPFAALRHLPLFGTLRVANRFVIPAGVALCVLAAWGVRWLLSRDRAFISGFRLFILIVAVLLLDFLWIPYPLRELPAPKWVAALPPAPSGLLLNIPGGHRARGADDLYLQTLHGRQTVGGYTSVVPSFMEKRVHELPFLQIIFQGIPKVEVETLEGLEQLLEALPIEIVVLHLDRERERLVALAVEHAGSPDARRFNPHKGIPRQTLEEVRAALQTLWGAAHYRDPTTEIWVRPR